MLKILSILLLVSLILSHEDIFDESETLVMSFTGGSCGESETELCPNFFFGENVDDLDKGKGFNFEYLSIIEVDEDGKELLYDNKLRGITSLPEDWDIEETFVASDSFNSTRVFFSRNIADICVIETCNASISADHILVTRGNYTSKFETTITENELMYSFNLNNWPFHDSKSKMRLSILLTGKNLESAISSSTSGNVLKIKDRVNYAEITLLNYTYSKKEVEISIDDSKVSRGMTYINFTFTQENNIYNELVFSFYKESVLELPLETVLAIIIGTSGTGAIGVFILFGLLIVSLIIENVGDKNKVVPKDRQMEEM